MSVATTCVQPPQAGAMMTGIPEMCLPCVQAANVASTSLVAACIIMILV
jgi:hypothetical protein